MADLYTNNLFQKRFWNFLCNGSQFASESCEYDSPARKRSHKMLFSSEWIFTMLFAEDHYVGWESNSSYYDPRRDESHDVTHDVTSQFYGQVLYNIICTVR